MLFLIVKIKRKIEMYFDLKFLLFPDVPLAFPVSFSLPIHERSSSRARRIDTDFFPRQSFIKALRSLRRLLHSIHANLETRI